jgi:hypothetical protein
MNEEIAVKSKTLEMLQDTLYFERNINDSRLSDFQKCFRETVKITTRKIGFQSREEMIKRLESVPEDDFWATVKKLHKDIQKRVDRRMNVMSELFFKGDELDHLSRVFFQSTFQRIRRIISTSTNENVKIISEILYRLIILSVFCQYRKSIFDEAIL